MTRQNLLTKLGTYIFPAGGYVGRIQIGTILVGVTIFGSMLTCPAPGMASERAFFSAFPDMDILVAHAPSDSDQFFAWKPKPPSLPAEETDREETTGLGDPEEIPVFSSVLGGVDASVGGSTGAVVSSVAGVVIPFAAAPSPSPAGAASFLGVFREEKEPDLVLSQQDVDVLVERNEEAEPVVALDAAFFANAPEEIEKGADGSYAGLTRRIDKFIRYFQTRAGTEEDIGTELG